MSRVTRQRIAIKAGLRAFLREPTNLVFLVVLPPLVMVAFDLALDPIAELPTFEAPPGAAEIGGALFATAFLAGLLGIFQVVGSASADRRLVICGYRPTELLLARLLTILFAGALVATLTFATFLVLVDLTPEAPLVALVVLVLAAIVYGLLGVILGALIGRELEASLVLVFLADFDVISALDMLPTEGAIHEFLPLAAPSALLQDAVTDGTIALGDLLQTGGSILILGIVAILLVSWRGGRE